MGDLAESVPVLPAAPPVDTPVFDGPALAARVDALVPALEAFINASKPAPSGEGSRAAPPAADATPPAATGGTGAAADPPGRSGGAEPAATTPPPSRVLRTRRSAGGGAGTESRSDQDSLLGGIETGDGGDGDWSVLPGEAAGHPDGFDNPALPAPGDTLTSFTAPRRLRRPDGLPFPFVPKDSEHLATFPAFV